MGVYDNKMERVIIIGNSGSGKTHLAQRMSGCLDIDVIHLDELFWEPGGFNQMRSQDIVYAEIANFAQGQAWIVEGIFGELAKEFFLFADTLIWLDMDWATCMAGLRARHAERMQAHSQGETDESFTELLKWASEYWQRLGPRSYKGHQQLFGEFRGRKIRLASRRAVENFIETIPGIRIWG